MNNIHNATFHDKLNAIDPTIPEQAYGFGNFHENGVFSDVSTSGIGNGMLLGSYYCGSGFDHNDSVAFRTILPSVFSSLTRIANDTDPLKLALNGISYKPFISFFSITSASILVDGVQQSLFGIGRSPV